MNQARPSVGLRQPSPARRHLLALALWAAAGLSAGTLAACGGGGLGEDTPVPPPNTRGSFTSVVSFGDSLSDVGTYTPATSVTGNGQPPYFGGRFTTNGDGAKVWVENVATSLGLAITPHQVGFKTTSTICPAAAQGAGATCTGYGQGGARVTDPEGIGKSGGALTVPVQQQLANHLARFGGYTEHDLVFVWAGNNDASLQFRTYAAVLTQVQTQAAQGAITPEQAQAASAQALAQAQQAIQAAAQELVGYVNDSILGKGAKYVAVIGLPDATRTPSGAQIPGAIAPAFTGLIDLFNQTLREGLARRPVLWVDSNAIFATVMQTPSTYGLSNITSPACSITLIEQITGGGVSDGSSLFCNATVGAPYYGLNAGATPTTWLWADDVHPTTGGHKALSDGVWQRLQAAGWVQ